MLLCRNMQQKISAPASVLIRAVGKVFSSRIMEHTLCLEQIYEILLLHPYIFNRAGHISVFVETNEAQTINKIYKIEKIPHVQRFMAGQHTMVRGSQMDFTLNAHREM